MEAPVFTIPLPRIILEAGKPLELAAAINPFNQPFETVWQKDKKAILANAIGITTSFTKGCCTLKIDSCSLTDAGEYSVTVRNQSAFVTASMKITIKGVRNYFEFISHSSPRFQC